MKQSTIPVRQQNSVGIVSVKLLGDHLIPSSSAVVDIDGSTASKDLEFDFSARSAGDVAMTYEYTSNQRRIAVEPVRVTIADTSSGCIPRVEDVSGCWTISWGDYFGDIVVSVGAHGRLTGTYDVMSESDGHPLKGIVRGYSSGSNVYLVLDTDKSNKVVQHPFIANLLEVQGDDRLVLCGTISGNSSKPFVTGVWEPSASESKICSTANVRALARSQ